MNILEKYFIYEELLKKWARVHNLISIKTLSDIRARHILDSESLLPFISLEDRVVDIGSGAGFPGMVLAMNGRNVTLVESDAKKCLFLEFVSRETNSKVLILNKRLEDVFLDFVPDKITARGVASLRKLIEISTSISQKDKTIGLFLKGEKASQELKEVDVLKKEVEWIKNDSRSSGIVRVFF